MRTIKLTAVSVALALGGLASTAQAAICDLTTLDATCTINGGIYTEGSFDLGAGTGIFPSFVQVAGGGGTEVKDAYNTTVNNTLVNGSSDIFNRAIQVQNLTIFTDGSETQYYEFFLDINQNKGGSNEWLSLSDVQIFTSTIANQSVETFTGGVVDINGTLRYRMDAGEDSAVQLLFGLHPGSGVADMQLLIPVSLFAGASGTDFVYLYSKFGDWEFNGGGTNNDGFEEWALRPSEQPGTCPPGTFGTPPNCFPPDELPEPGTLALLGLGLLGLGFSRRRQG